jgi:hypothetical protein
MDKYTKNKLQCKKLFATRIKEETIISVTDTHINELLTNFFGFKYELVEVEGTDRGIYFECKVDTSSFDFNNIEKLKDTKDFKQLDLEEILSYMAYEGIIKKGKYLIEVEL